MSNLVLVTPDGVVVSDKQSPQVEKHQEEESFDVRAQREAAAQSTPIKKAK